MRRELAALTRLAGLPGVPADAFRLDAHAIAARYLPGTTLAKLPPARVSTAMTIGATDKTDKKTSWSNYGNCVDWFAPGLGITSAWYTSDVATNTISGTSMATPHTTGVAALYLDAHDG